MKKVLIFMLLSFFVYGQERIVDQFCKQSRTPNFKEVFRLLNQNYPTKNCIQLYKKLHSTKSIILFCQSDCSLDPFVSLLHLRRLEMINGGLVAIDVVGAMKDLRKLNIYRNLVRDITPLRGLNKLEWLIAGRNNLSDVAVLKGMKNLRFLELDNNKIEMVPDLSASTRLRDIDLSNNNLVDLSFLKEVFSVRDLDLSHNEIVDVSSLRKLRRLQKLNLKGNPIKKNRQSCPFGRGVPSVLSRFCRSYLRG